MILALFLLAAAEVLLAVTASPTYTVVAPDVVRPNTDFRVAISAHDIDQDQGNFFYDHETDERIVQIVFTTWVLSVLCGFLVAQLNDDAYTAQDVKLTIRGVSDSGQTIEINQATTVQSDQTQGRNAIDIYSSLVHNLSQNLSKNLS